MINFFRKIRQKLLTENKFSKYLIYAIGEIALIMIGIFMALQLQIWNAKNKQEAQFQSTLEQIYTTIKYDSELFLGSSNRFEKDSEFIKVLLDHPDSIPDVELPVNLHLLAFGVDRIFSEASLYAKDLIPNPENKRQEALTKEVLNYVNSISNYKNGEIESLGESLQDIHIAIPNLDPSLNLADSTYYDAIDYANCRELLRTRAFRASLKSANSISKYNYYNTMNRYNDGLSIMRLIKEYYPDVKILYKDVGIIGTSINGYDDVGAKSTPMTLIDENEGIWEITMFLKKGTVKFRCRDSWSQNWGAEGAKGFPKGKARHDGIDIPISIEGNYKITLDLTETIYTFLKLED
jgi:hypothetical protein